MASLSNARGNGNLHILAAKRLIGTARVDISCLHCAQCYEVRERVPAHRVQMGFYMLANHNPKEEE
jgi:hypothetical protein